MSIKMSLDPQTARDFIKIMGAVVDEFRLRIDKDGWKVVAVDPANVAMVFVNLPKDNFQSYEFGNDTWTSNILDDQITVGIDVDKIKQFLGMHRSRPSLLDEELHAPVEFIFSMAPEKHCGRYQLELKQGMFSRTILLLLEKEIRKSPENPIFKLDYKLQIGTLDFRRIIEKAAEISDYINLGFSREYIREMTDDPERHKEKHAMTFIASTVDSENFPWNAIKQIHGWQALSDTVRTNSSSLFSLDYLLDIAEKLPDTVWLHLGQDNPCRISFDLGQTGTVEYYLAPRIESE